MCCFSGSVVDRLQEKIIAHQMNIAVRPDHFILENSQHLTDVKVAELIESIGFCPLLLPDRVEQNVAFTVVPYRLPTRFSDQTNLAYQAVNKRIKSNASENSVSYQLHFSKIKANALTLAQMVEGEALILGIGNGDDIPLLELAQRFNRITVVDIDLKAMQETVQRLPVVLQAKIDFAQKDLTGLIASLSAKIEHFDASLSDIECLTRTAEYLVEFTEQPRENILADKKYNLVISAMLTSQLTSQLHNYVFEVLEAKFKSIRKAEAQAPAFSRAIQVFGNYICPAHIEDLAEWTHRKGKVLYVDHGYGESNHYKVHAVRHEGSIELKEYDKISSLYSALPNELIQSKIDDLFVPVHKNDRWDWVTRLPEYAFTPYPTCIRPENVMKVCAVFLQPK